jgi:hypothetical protein
MRERCQILPGAGRWREAPEGVRLLAQHLRSAPSTMLRMVPLPVNGEDL